MSTASVLRVIPIHSAPDVVNFRQRTDPGMLVDAVLGDRHSLPFQEVLDALVCWANGALLPRGSDKHAREFMAGMHVWLALAEPKTPFGAAVAVGGGRDSTVYFRGAWYDRDRRGVLTRLGDESSFEVDPEMHEVLVDMLERYRP
jgi:hypothetical protein